MGRWSINVTPGGGVAAGSGRRLAMRSTALGLAASLCLNTIGCANRNIHPANQHWPATASASDSALAHELYAYYSEWRGVPYRYGGQSKNGIDCSSFVRHTIRTVEAVDLPRTTAAQARRGDSISRDDLAPGDLVFFRTGGGYRHVGVYVGRQYFMHASTSHGVIVSPLDNPYWRRHYWQARRLTD